MSSRKQKVGKAKRPVGKSTTAPAPNKDGDTRRRDEMETKIRKRVALEEKAFRLVEKLLENNITSQQLMQAGQYIDTNHYADIVTERAVSDDCGYPLCLHSLANVPKQKYHISSKSNKVYDITDRKKFCSNQCYKASLYFEKQISDTPVWLREEEPTVTFDLLGIDSHCSHQDRIGEQVTFSPEHEIKQELDELEGKGKQRHSKRSWNPKQTGAKENKVDTEASRSPNVTDDGKQTVTEVAESMAKVCIEESLAEVSADTPPQTDQSQSRNRERINISYQSDCTGGVPSELPSQSESRVMLDEVELWNSPRVPRLDSSLFSSMTTDQTPPEQTLPTLPISEPQQEILAQTTSGPSSSSRGASLLEERLSSRRYALEDHPPVETGPHGVDTKNVAVTATQNKAQMLMELLDKQEQLTANLNQQKKSKDPIAKSSKKEVPKRVMDRAHPEELHTSSIVNIGVSDQKKSSKPSSNILASIQRAKQQQARLTASRTVTPTQQKLTPPQTSQKAARPKKPKLRPLESIRNTLMDWKSVQTVCFLNREPASYNPPSDFEAKYAELGRRVEGHDWSNFIGEERIDNESAGPSGKLPSMQQLRKDTEEYEGRVQEFFQWRTDGAGEDPSQGEGRIKTEPEMALPVSLPLVDHNSQQAHRRKIVLDKINRVFPELLGPLRMTISEVGSDLRQLVHTFNLTSTNISMRPAEWTLMAFFLLKLIACCKPSLHRALSGEVAIHYFRTMLLSLNITEGDVSRVIHEMSVAG